MLSEELLVEYRHRCVARLVVVDTRGLDCSENARGFLLSILVTAHAVEKAAAPAFVVLLASFRQAAQRARVTRLERIEVRMLAASTSADKDKGI